MKQIVKYKYLKWIIKIDNTNKNAIIILENEL